MNTVWKVTLCLLAIVAVTSTASAVEYTMVDLGQLNGWDTTGLDINDAGAVVGLAYGTDGMHAFKWSDATGMVDLGLGAAGGINNLGQIAGNLGGTPCIWETDGTVTYLAGSGGASAINDAGQVAGLVFTASGNHAAFWDSDGTLTDFGSLVGNAESYAVGINNSSHLCGYGMVGPATMHGFRWSAQGGAVDLGPLPGGTDSRAFDINDSSIVVGAAEYLGTDQYVTAWYPGGGVSKVSASRVIVRGTGMGVNNAGQIVASSSLWELDGSMVTLPGNGYAREINDAGWIVGDADGHAVLWTPVPEPSAILILLCGLGGLAWRKRK